MKNMLNRVKGFLAVMMMACMLLTMGGVSSNAEAGIRLCGTVAETEIDESK